jgi:hypothetical protein
MPITHLILDDRTAAISAVAIPDFSQALARAEFVNAPWIVTSDDLLMPSLVSRLHACASREELWDVLTAERFGLVDVVPVRQEVVAAPKRNMYPTNIRASARPVWDEIVKSERFLKATTGRPEPVKYAIAVKWLHDACRRRGFSAFIDDTQPKSPREQVLRDLRICKSYVEQVFRNMQSLRLALRQTNWTEPKLVLHGNLYRVESAKRVTLRVGASERTPLLLKRYEGFNGEDLKASPTPNSKVLFDVRPAVNDMVVTFALEYTKAQLVVMTGLDAKQAGANFSTAAQTWLRQTLREQLREVVASDSNAVLADVQTDAKQRERVRHLAQKIVRLVNAGKLKGDGEIEQLTLLDSTLGSRPMRVQFEDFGRGEEAHGETNQLGKFSPTTFKIKCDFNHYGLPTSLRADVEDTDLFTMLEHELEHVLDFKCTLGRDSSTYDSRIGRHDHVDERKYYNTPEEFNAYLQSMISEWSRRNEQTYPSFPEFYAAFKSYWKPGRQERQFLEALDPARERRAINRLYSYWTANRVSATVNELRVMDEFEIEPLDRPDQKTKLPVGAVLRPVKHGNDDEPVYQVAHPHAVLGLRLTLSPEQHTRCAHIDNEIDTFDGSILAAYELLTEEFEKLSTVYLAGGKIAKLLGPLSTWQFAENRAWLHHLNLKSNHVALTFEVIQQGEEPMLAAVYSGS